MAGVGGSKPGPKKQTVVAREALWKVFHRLGGVDHMEKWAKENPSEYYRLFARLIPQATEVSGPEGGPVQHELGHVALPPRVGSLAEWRERVAEVFGEYGAAASAGADEQPE